VHLVEHDQADVAEALVARRPAGLVVVAIVFLLGDLFFGGGG
jgi:hypothetical protein